MALSVHRPAKRLRGKTPPEAQGLVARSLPPPNVQTPQPEPPALEEEKPDKRQMVYLITVSHPREQRSSCGVRLRAPNTFEREELRDAIIDAFANAIYQDHGNRSANHSNVELMKMVVFSFARKAHTLVRSAENKASHTVGCLVVHLIYL